jgi:methionyl-tRNA synthetase
MMQDFTWASEGSVAGWLLAMPFVLFALVAWSVIWKGLALWRAGRKEHLAWFIVLLVVNTCGILEIIYLLTAGKKTSPAQSGNTTPDVKA